jgi:hypothetical protein
MSVLRPALLKPVLPPHSSDIQPKPLSPRASGLKFGGGLPSASPVVARRVLEHLDFTAVGASPVKQIAVIFSSLITWRLLAANERRRASTAKRWNELRENLMRDLLGFAFWFLGVPVLQRLYLGAVAQKNPKLKDILIRHVQADAKKPEGVLAWLQANNPLNNRYIPSSQQVKDQMHQALSSLEKAGMGPKHAAYGQTQAAYLDLIKHRNLATALGLGSTIMLLGVGINLLNFYLTQKNVTRTLSTGNSATHLWAQPVSPNLNNPFQVNLRPTAIPGVIQPAVPAVY